MVCCLLGLRYIDADSLTSLVKLRELRIEDNGLRNLLNLSALCSLSALHAGNNRIGEFAELDRLTVLPSLAHVTLNGNPVARKQVNEEPVHDRGSRLWHVCHITVLGVCCNTFSLPNHAPITQLAPIQLYGYIMLLRATAPWWCSSA